MLAGRARRDLPAGTVLEMGGHHHDVTGVQAVLIRDEDTPADAAPLYLAAHATLGREVRAGDLITVGDLADPDADLLHAWTSGRASRATDAPATHASR